MTGFGSASHASERYRVTVDARSVNHRGLDVAMRLREPLRRSEKPLRDLVRSRLDRGRVELFVEVESLAEVAAEVEVDEALARAVIGALADLQQEGLVDRPTAGDLMRVPGVVRVRGTERDWTDDDEALLLEVAAAALDQLVGARRTEGDEIAAGLRRDLEGLRSAAELLAARREDVVADYRSALEERLAEIVTAAAVDPVRLEMEVALLVEKSDVTEEIDRLQAHLTTLREILGGESPAGKRLDFVLQEVLRELNTVGSKSRDLEISRAVVDGRLLCEQMREQVQNVE